MCLTTLIAVHVDFIYALPNWRRIAKALTPSTWSQIRRASSFYLMMSLKQKRVGTSVCCAFRFALSATQVVERNRHRTINPAKVEAVKNAGGKASLAEHSKRNDNQCHSSTSTT
jgi:hypothetical protein